MLYDAAVRRPWRLLGASLVFAIVSLLGSRAEASNPVVSADLDGDGVQDHISVEPDEPTQLLVWLSRVGTTNVLNTRRPVLGLVAADLDGDKRAELIFSDVRGVHVWTWRDARLHHVHKVGPRANTALSRSNRASRSKPEIQPLAVSESLTPEFALVERSSHGAPPARGISLWFSTRRLDALTVITPSRPRPPPSLL